MEHLTAFVTSNVIAGTFPIKQIVDITGTLTDYGLFDSERKGELHPGSAGNLLYFLATCKDSKELDQHLPDNDKTNIIGKAVDLIAARIRDNKPDDNQDIRNLTRLNIAKGYVCFDYDNFQVVAGTLAPHAEVKSFSGAWFREFYIFFYNSLLKIQNSK